MIKWKRHNGISVADTAEMLIPLSCSNTSICKHYYQASHPYNDVKKENHFYDRQLNTVGMGQDSMISNTDAVEILQSCTWPCLAIGMFQEYMHHYQAIH